MSKQASFTIEPEDYWQVVRPKLLLLAFIGFAVFFDGLLGVFALKDETGITQNPDLHGLSWRALLSSERTVYLTLALNYAISGVNPWSYHAVNIAIHILAALTLFGIACRTLFRTFTDPHALEARRGWRSSSPCCGWSTRCRRRA